MSGRLFRLPAVFLLGLALAPRAWAGSPTIKVLGRLSSAQGKALNGVASLEFMILDLDGGGTVVWNEMDDVRAAAGEYAAVLGLSSPLPRLGRIRPGWRLVVRPPAESGWVAEPLSFDQSDDPRRGQIARLLERFGIRRGLLERRPSSPKLTGLFGRRPSEPAPEAAPMEPAPQGQEIDADDLGRGLSGAARAAAAEAKEEADLAAGSAPRIAYDRDEAVSLEKIRHLDKVLRSEDAYLRKRLILAARKFDDRLPERKAGAIPVGAPVGPR